LPTLSQAAAPVGARNWEHSNRVWYGRALLSAGDDWLRAQLDRTALATLARREYGHILPAEDTVPEVLMPLFEDFASATAELWRLNDKLQLMVRNERLRLHLGRGRSNGRGTGRAPVVGAHVRLGDKEAEWDRDRQDFGVKNTYANMSVYWEGEMADRLPGAAPAPVWADWSNVLRIVCGAGGIEAVDRLEATSWASIEYAQPPTLLLMTAESSVLTAFASDPLSAGFAIETTTVPAPQSLADWSQDLKGIGLSPQQLKSAGRTTVLNSFAQQNFNALPDKLRIHLTTFFVRDLDILAKYADAAVVTGEWPNWLRPVSQGAVRDGGR